MPPPLTLQSGNHLVRIKSMTDREDCESSKCSELRRLLARFSMFRSPALPAAPLGLDVARVLRIAALLAQPGTGAGEAGYFAVARNQSGYSVDARPDPATWTATATTG
jgi:hypothetical protein